MLRTCQKEAVIENHKQTQTITAFATLPVVRALNVIFL